MTRVLIVDDDDLVRAALTMMLDGAAGISVVGQAADGDQVPDAVAAHAPDVVLMDLRMPLVDGTTATARIHAARPSVRVVVLTTFDDDDHLFPALAAGACGFLVKDAAPAELLAAVRTAAAGETPFSPAVLQRLVARAVQSRQAAPIPLPASLTAREREVLTLIAAGLSNREIGDRLHLAVTTVKTHVTSLLAKTGAPNRIRLALLAADSDPR